MTGYHFSTILSVLTMDFETTLQHFQQASQAAVIYLSQRANIEKIGQITAISVATYVVANVNITEK